MKSDSGVESLLEGAEAPADTAGVLAVPTESEIEGRDLDGQHLEVHFEVVLSKLQRGDQLARNLTENVRVEEDPAASVDLVHEGGEGEGAESISFDARRKFDITQIDIKEVLVEHIVSETNQSSFVVLNLVEFTAGLGKCLEGGAD